MDTVERIIEHAVKKSKDGRIDISDFLDEAAGSMRYGMFTPMEVSVPRNLMNGASSSSRPTSFGISQVEGMRALVNGLLWLISKPSWTQK